MAVISSSVNDIDRLGIRVLLYKFIITQEVKIMKRFLKGIIWAGALTVSYHLYQRQLGSIAFILLSIYFFIKAKREFSRYGRHGVDEIKRSTRGKR